MTDLDTRLHADADRIESVPDFAVALAVATRTRRPSPAWWAVAAAVVIIAGSAGIAAVARGSHSHRSTASGGAADGPSIVGAISSPDSSAPKQLMIVIRHQAGTCVQAGVSVQESATEVTVRVTSHDLESGSAVPARSINVSVPDGAAPTRPPVSVGHACGGSDPYTAAVLGTNAPLGSRRLVDAATGNPIVVFTATVPSVGDVPAGYSEPYPDATDPMSAATLDFRPGALSPITLGRFYRNQASDRLIVVAAPTADVVPGATVVDTTSVDGHRATVTETDETRCVTWAPTPTSGLQVCSDVHGATDDPAIGLLNEADLLAVANSLR